MRFSRYMALALSYSSRRRGHSSPLRARALRSEHVARALGLVPAEAQQGPAVVPVHPVHGAAEPGR